MSTTKRSGQKPVTGLEALQILQSAVGYCQQAGMTVQAANKPEGLTLVILGGYYVISSNAAQFLFSVGDAHTSQDNEALRFANAVPDINE